MNWNACFTRSAVLVAALVLDVLSTSGAAAQAQQEALAPATVAAAAPAQEPYALSVSPEVRRAVRTARAGGVLMAAGAAGLLAGGIVMARTHPDCPITDIFCGNSWTRFTGADVAIVAGAGLFLVGAVSLGVGIGLRNRRRPDGASLTFGPGSARLRLHF